MDVFCQKCGEPWDVFSVSEFRLAEDGGTRKDFLAGKGCPSCDWGQDQDAVESTPSMRTMLMEATADLLGDDIDGIASAMDDAEWMGFLD